MRVRLARDPARAAIPLSGGPPVLRGRGLGFLASQLGRAVLLVIGTLRPQLGFRVQPVLHLVSRFRAPREIQFVGSSGDRGRVGHVCTSWTAEANHRDPGCNPWQSGWAFDALATQTPLGPSTI